MRLTLLPMALSALTLAASFTPQAPRQAPPVFKSRLDVVTVQTAVRSGGKWVPTSPPPISNCATTASCRN